MQAENGMAIVVAGGVVFQGVGLRLPLANEQRADEECQHRQQAANETTQCGHGNGVSPSAAWPLAWNDAWADAVGVPSTGVA